MGAHGGSLGVQGGVGKSEDDVRALVGEIVQVLLAGLAPPRRSIEGVQACVVGSALKNAVPDAHACRGRLLYRLVHRHMVRVAVTAIRPVGEDGVGSDGFELLAEKFGGLIDAVDQRTGVIV